MILEVNIGRVNTKRKPVAVVALSGGMDSTTLLYYVKKILKYEKIYAIGIDYGQTNVKELDYAKQICNKTAVPFYTINLRSLFEKGSDSLITGEITTKMEEQYTTVVNLRNTIFLTAIAKFALDKGWEAVDIFYSPVLDDFKSYVDCREEFIQSISQTLRLGSDGVIRGVFAPFVRITKKEMVKLGKKLNVPFSETWSCYYGGDKPCGQCPACIERTQAFSED